MATIVLSNEEKENFFHSALCNGGLSELEASGIELDYNQSHYTKAKVSLKSKGELPCFEDILLEILKQGNKLSFKDVECDDTYSKDVTLQMVHDNVLKAPQNVLMDYINGNDDAWTAYELLQAVLYDGEIIFG